MRSAAQIGSTVEQWHELQRTERAATLKKLLAELRQARDSGAEWYEWIANGRPALTPERYLEVDRLGRKKRA